VKVPQNALDLVARVFIDFKNNDAVEFSRDFDGVSNLDRFRVTVFRRRDGIALKKKAASLLQGAFRGSGKMGHAEFGVRPDRNRGKRAAVRVSEKNHAAPHAPQHTALEGQPALAERFGSGGLNKLAPQISVKLGTGGPF
jgi:hypothetical protein